MIKTTNPYFLFLFLILSQLVFSQGLEEEIYPKADIHLGMSLSKGTYLGSTVQISNTISIEASYGGNVAYFLGPTDPQRRISFGLNYHLWWPVIINSAYIFKEQLFPGYFKSHSLGLSIGLLSLRNRGIHFIVSLGSYFEYENKFNVSSKHFRFNANLGIGFTFL
ncbi:MAG TPA: hypothetical protein VLN45_10560 [Ignavibacteriaceae bacterium]|nr:hypothetical protein [Ignavibacteriaceae bacterium]